MGCQKAAAMTAIPAEAEAIHPDVRAYLRTLYLEMTKKDLPA